MTLSKKLSILFPHYAKPGMIRMNSFTHTFIPATIHIGIVNKSAVEKSPKIATGKNASELTEWSEAERRKFRCGAKRKAAS